MRHRRARFRKPGISLAALCAALGYRMRAVVPSRVPQKKTILLGIAGAEQDVVSDEVCPSRGSEPWVRTSVRIGGG